MQDLKAGRKKLTKEQRREIYDMFHGHCAYCGCEIALSDMQADHIIPLRRGGRDDTGNMYPAYRSCNHYKHTMTVEEFREYVRGIPSRLRRDSIPYQVGIRFGLIHDNRDVKFYFERDNYRKD